MKKYLFFLVMSMLGGGCGSPPSSSNREGGSSDDQALVLFSRSLPAEEGEGANAEENDQGGEAFSQNPVAAVQAPGASEQQSPGGEEVYQNAAPSGKVAGYLTSRLSAEQEALYQKLAREQEGSFFPPLVVGYRCTAGPHSVKLTLRQYRRVGQTVSLLCDFFTGDTLQAFAVHQSLFCENRMEKLLATLSSVDYDCVKE